uniref:Tudor domain-containing protein n=1 Tax=Romanomermis culicivorax TaxID=13658 RepID=A0A915IUD4_ROMCU
MEGRATIFPIEKFETITWENVQVEDAVILPCTKVVMIGGGLADNARVMEEKYPNKCWRYQDSQSQLLTRNLKANDDRTLKQNDNGDGDGKGKTKNDGGFVGVASFIVSPVEFYLQPSFVLNKINRLLLEMCEFYKDDMEPVPHDELYEGMPCAARFQDDKQWYRAVVVKAGLNDARIVFVDWGNSQFEPLFGIKPLTKEFGRLPPLTLRCRIDGARERTMFQKVIDQFQSEMETLQRVVLCIPTSIDELGSMNVHLLNHETKEDIGQKYIPKEPLCPHTVEYYENEIRKLDLTKLEQQNTEIDQPAGDEQTTSDFKYEKLVDGETASNYSDLNRSVEAFVEERKVRTPNFNYSPELSVEELDKKYEKFQQGLYSSDMEAFFDGAPIFSDSDEDGIKPKQKSLKQMKREAKLKSEGRWPPMDQKNQRSLSVIMQNRFYRTPDGTEYIKDFSKAIKPPKGDQEIVISRVISAREIYLHTDSQVQFLETLHNKFKRHLDPDAMPLSTSKHTTGMACVYYDVTSDLWYRARINEVAPGEISLHLIDKAKTIWIGQSKFDTIKALPAVENYFFLEPQVFKCKLRHLCEPSPVAIENDLIRQLLPVDQKFMCHFERDREPWRIKLFDPKTYESIIDKFNAEMEVRHLKVRADHQRTRLGDVALHRDTPYTRAKFAEIRDHILLWNEFLCYMQNLVTKW